MRKIVHGYLKAKTAISELQGKPLVFRINRGRNRFEFYSGTVENLYPNIFTIRTDNADIPILSFSYNDLLTKNVQIQRPASSVTDSAAE